MAASGKTSKRLPGIGEWDVWPRGLKIDRQIVGATSSDGDEDIVLNSTATEDFALWDVAAGTFVHRVLCVIETAFTASVTIDVGDTSDVNGWLEAADIGATSTDAGLTQGSSDASTVHIYAMQGGRYYQSTGVIEADFSGATPAAGRAIFYCIYSQLSS